TDGLREFLRQDPPAKPITEHMPVCGCLRLVHWSLRSASLLGSTRCRGCRDRAQPLERLALDLAAALLAHPKPCPDLLVGLRDPVAQAVVAREHLPVAV